MAGKKRKADARGPLQRVIEAERGPIIERDGVALHQDTSPLVSPFTRQHGDYEDYLKRTVNRGGTPIARWRKAGILSDSQQAAIEHCIRLWRLVTASGRLVANLDRTVFGSPGDGHSAEVEARDDLKRIKGYVGERYFSVFENVVRFDEPAGVAGSRLEQPSANRELAARFCVQFVADIITMKERLTY
jgi:hypothetical protein